MMRPPVKPVRVEPMLLERLRDAFPDVVFGSVKARLNPPSTQVVLAAEPGQLASAISQYVTVRISCYVVRGDGTGDWQAAQNLAAQVENMILRLGTTRPLIDAEHSSGPLRLVEDDLIMTYSTVLLTVRV